MGKASGGSVKKDMATIAANMTEVHFQLHTSKEIQSGPLL